MKVDRLQLLAIEIVVLPELAIDGKGLLDAIGPATDQRPFNRKK